MKPLVVNAELQRSGHACTAPQVRRQYLDTQLLPAAGGRESPAARQKGNHTVKLLALLAICATIAAMHAAADDDRTEAAPREVAVSEGCQVVKYTIPSPSMQRPIKVVVVLPPGYDAEADKTYPVLYALHGRGAPYTVWSDMSPLKRALRTQPMIVAGFDCDYAGFYIDSKTKPDSQFRTFFFDEFTPHIETAYRANGVRGVTGFSMGGYGALYYMVERPHLFASISALSAAVGIVRGDDGNAHENMRDLIGPYRENEQTYEKLIIAKRVAAGVADQVKLPPIMLHCGTEDHLVKRNREFLQVLIDQNKLIRERLAPQVADEPDQRQQRRKLGDLERKHRIDFTYIESPGGHDWPFWRDASAGVIDFHWKSFQKARPVALKSAKQTDEAAD